MKPLKILIGCEESQTVTKAFRALGFEAYSNDLKDCSGGHPEWHLKMDVFKAIDWDNWDLVGLHPVCTKMALSGNRTYAPGKERHAERLASVEWTLLLWKIATIKCQHVYMENPMGAMNGNRTLPKPQIVHPYFFGDEYQKTTCLWLKGLPFLLHNDRPNLFEQTVTHVSRGEMVRFDSGKVMPKWLADSPSTNNEENRTLRSKTFPGIANAMASQWGEYLIRINEHDRT